MSISWVSHPTFSVHFHTFCQFPFGSFVSQVFLREAGEALASLLPGRGGTTLESVLASMQDA